jgi:hypothetical protein
MVTTDMGVVKVSKKGSANRGSVLAPDTVYAELHDEERQCLPLPVRMN